MLNEKLVCSPYWLCRVFARNFGEYAVFLGRVSPANWNITIFIRRRVFGCWADQHNVKVINTRVCRVAVVALGQTC